MFCQLIRRFGFHIHFAPGEADAELGRLSADSVSTLSSSVSHTPSPKKKTDGDDISVHTSKSILKTPSIGLSRGGLLVFALLAGGDYDPPYNLHAVLRAHVEFGVSSDEDFPRSSVFRVMKTKQVSYHGQPLLLRQVEMSAGALGLRVKAGIADASAFPTPSLMTKWIPAAIIDYAFPDLVSRSRRLAVSHSKRAENYHQVSPKATNRKTLQGQGSSSSRTSYLSDSTLSDCDVIDLTASDEEDI
ncbi:hypothetical protein R3P38DRAFT_3496449 [Favolaschia claudopus]|uniref:Uncharacterized protein n=1 Tax=Favolaschia claudopus TaxID=2862362 RepID=A0AAW0C5X7_9AGAR